MSRAEPHTSKTMNRFRLVSFIVACLTAITASGQDTERPNVAILIYDGVQIIDHAAPWEVLGQYSLNNVYTVAKDTMPVTTYMGMRVLPSYGFDDHPVPDVVVIPGGDTGDTRTDPEIIDWIRHNVTASEYVLGICSGVPLLAETGLLDGRRVTTFYNLLDDLAAERPDIDVIDDELVVEDSKYITTTGTGVEGSLRVVELLHGEPWAHVVTLNMEFEPLPKDERTPRARLADMNLPSSIYGAFPWREADLTVYEGDADAWTMTWRWNEQDPSENAIGDLVDALIGGLRGEDWSLDGETRDDAAWASDWTLRGRDDDAWRGMVEVRREMDGRLQLRIIVDRG